MTVLAMPRFFSVIWLSHLLVSSSTAHIIPGEVNTQQLNKRATLVQQTYPAFQISNGRAGDCANKAAQKFLAPYKLDQDSLLGPNPKFGVAIDRTDLQVARQMSKLAIDAENNFNRAISKAGGIKTALGQQLQNGKICNKVLKLTGQVLFLQMAVNLNQDQNARQSLPEKIKKLQKNISLDAAAQGQTQKSFLNV